MRRSSFCDYVEEEYLGRQLANTGVGLHGRRYCFQRDTQLWQQHIQL